MEKIKQRSMRNYVLSCFINVGIGIVSGLIYGLIGALAVNNISFVDIPAGIIAIPSSILFGIIVTAFTANLYRVHFFYSLSLDINTLCEGDGQETESYLQALVLSMLTFGLYQIYWIYKLAQRLRVNSPRYGYKMMETGKEIVILHVFSYTYISTWELIKNVNRISKVYNQNGLAKVVGGVQ